MTQNTGQSLIFSVLKRRIPIFTDFITRTFRDGFICIRVKAIGINYIGCFTDTTLHSKREKCSGPKAIRHVT